jgi:hypothetical protein
MPRPGTHSLSIRLPRTVAVGQLAPPPVDAILRLKSATVNGFGEPLRARSAVLRGDRPWTGGRRGRRGEAIAHDAEEQRLGQKALEQVDAASVGPYPVARE